MERSVEYIGDATTEFTADIRFLIANMTAGWWFKRDIQADENIADWLKQRPDYKDSARYFEPMMMLRASDAIGSTSIELQVAKPFSLTMCIQ